MNFRTMQAIYAGDYFAGVEEFVVREGFAFVAGVFNADQFAIAGQHLEIIHPIPSTPRGGVEGRTNFSAAMRANHLKLPAPIASEEAGSRLEIHSQVQEHPLLIKTQIGL